MKAGLIAMLEIWLAAAASAQPSSTGATINGQVVDGTSGVGLSDVRVQVQGLPDAMVTDRDGRFHLSGVTPGPHVVVVSVVGYVLVRREVTVGIGGTIYLLIPLAEGTGTYSERVEVTGELFRQAEPGVPAQQVLGSSDLQNLRGLVLDDPVRALHVLPGVAATDDFYANFSVRGASFAHIGLAIDGVASPFLSHTVQGVEESGSIGMVNSDILERMTLMNGSYPERYGNRTGAEVEMTLRDGSRDRAGARVALSGSSASVVGEGPLGRTRRGSWLISARKSYLDLLIKQVSDQNNFAFGFADLAGKLAWDLTDRQKVEVSVVGGRSELDGSQLHVGFNDPLVATSGAMLASVAWQYAPRPTFTLSQHLSVTGGRYHNQSLARVVLDEGKSLTIAWRADLTAAIGKILALDAGGSVAGSHDTAKSRRVVDPSRPSEVREDATLDSTLSGAYAEARWTLPRGALVAAGVRVDSWTGTHQTTWSPWARGEMSLGGFDVTAGTGVYRQFPDFNQIAGIRGTPDLDAQRAWQTDLGVARRIRSALRAQAVVYVREGRDGIRLHGDDWQIVDGRLTPPRFDTHYLNALDEQATGVELQLQRRSPNGLTGWVSYTFGHTKEHDLTTGERLDGDFDQRHAVNLYGIYRVSDRTSVSLKLRAASNFPVSGYVQQLPDIPSLPVPSDQPARYAVAAAPNTARLPAYARMDLRANRTFTVNPGRLTLYVELMNVTRRTNWRVGAGSVRPTGEIRDLLKPLVPFVPSAGLLWEF